MSNNTNQSVQSGKPIIGMNRDFPKRELRQGEIIYAKNAIPSNIEGNITNIQNIPSTIECLNLNGKIILGNIYVKEHDFNILFLYDKNHQNHSINLFYDCYDSRNVIILEETCLNFNINYPIKGVYRYDFNNNLIIYFQDGFNSDRKINLTNFPKLKGNNDCSTFNKLDCNAINIINDYSIPEIKLEAINETGALLSGSYQFKIAYADSTGNELSNYYSLTNSIPIYRDKIQGFENIEGSNYNTPTNKSIRLTFLNLDTKEDYISLAIIKTINNSTTYEKIVLPITTNSYIYTGRETTMLLTLDQINNSIPIYKKSKTITTANNYLIRANVEDATDINLQWLANRIQLQWGVIELEADTASSTYKNPLIQESYAGYMRGEVYPLGIKFHIKGNIKTRVFHLMNRKAISSDKALITDNCESFDFENNLCNTNSETASLEKWRIKDTSIITSTIPETIDCNIKLVMKGDFAYYESTDVYPCNNYYEDNANKPIRHFKFPANETVHIHDIFENSTIPNNPEMYEQNSNNEKLFNKNSKIYPIGVQLKESLEYYIIQLINDLNNPLSSIHNYITSSEKEQLLNNINNIEGYEILRADRKGNSSVIAKGLLFNAREYDVFAEGVPTQKMYYPNYPYNSTEKDPYHKINASGSADYEYSETIYPKETDDGNGSITYDKNDKIISGFTYNNITPGDEEPFMLISSTPELINLKIQFQLSAYQANEANYNWEDEVQVKYRLEEFINYFPGIHFGETMYRLQIVLYFSSEDSDNSVLTINNNIDNNFTYFYYDENGDPISPNLGENYYESSMYYTGSSNNISKLAYTFHSPETHFNNPLLGNELRTHTIEYGGVKGYFSAVEDHPEMKVAKSSKSAWMNHAAQYKSVSNYSKFYTNENIVKRRLIEESFYLGNNATHQVNDIDFHRFNNKYRESSVFLRIPIGCSLKTPKEVNDNLIDNTLFTLTSKSNNIFSKSTVTLKSDKRKELRGKALTGDYNIYTRASSYYASINNYIPNQYGQLQTVKYLSTGKYISRYQSDNKLIFGGDTFINRMTLKRKHAFFALNILGETPVGINYKDNPNVIRPVYYAINDKTSGFLGAGRPEYEIDTSSNLNRYDIQNQGGFFYLYNYGVLNFFAESTINTDLRYSGPEEVESHYPTLKNTTLDRWLEQKHSPIELDNFYYYDQSYSKQSTEEVNIPITPSFEQGTGKYPKRIIYSKQNSYDSISDNWLVFQPNNRYDSEENLGEIIDIQALDTFRVLVRYENGLQIFNAYDTLQLQETIVTLGTGGMFQQRPKTFAETEVGYAGTNSKFSINITQFGTFIIDENNGKVFKYASNLEEISKNKMSSWFKTYMKLEFIEMFKAIQHLPNSNKYNFDNPYAGVGYISIYDYKYDMWFLTKKDYTIKDINNLKYISFNVNGEMFYKNKPVDFNDNTIWEDKSWTIGFSSVLQSWYSFYDFKPNFYLKGKSKFYSGNDIIFKHWDYKTFQNIYNIYRPFMFTVSSGEVLNHTLHTIEYDMRVLEYYDYNSYRAVESNVGFNKIYINTDKQTSGIINLYPKNSKDLLSLIDDNKIINNELYVPYNKLEGNKFRLNSFSDIVKDPYESVIYQERDIREPLNYDYSRINNLLNVSQKFRNEWFEITYIQDNPDFENYAFIFNLSMHGVNKSYR